MQTTRINGKLNLVIPVDGTASGTVYVHSTPISRDVFERHFRVLARSFAAIYQERLNIFAGPRVSKLLLQQTAEELGLWDTPGGVRDALIPEIFRLTNVAVANGNGWETIPYHEAVAKKLLDEDDAAEVENAVCFFICNSAIMRRDQLPAILDGMTSLWGALTTSSTCSEYAASLPPSIEVTPLKAIA
jgi:hypothetical protein